MTIEINNPVGYFIAVMILIQNIVGIFMLTFYFVECFRCRRR